jgi:hypothetical protein
MAPDRRPDRISDLYHAALKHPPAERSAFLAAACGGDEALREEVESLLAYEPASSEFLETSGIRRGRGRTRARGFRRTSARPVLHPGPTRRRRHGRGLSRTRHEAGPRRRHQDPAAARDGRSGATRPLCARSAHPRHAEPSAHRRDLRARTERRRRCARPRAGRRPDARRPPRTRGIEACRRARHCAPDRGCARRRA